MADNGKRVSDKIHRCDLSGMEAIGAGKILAEAWERVWWRPGRESGGGGLGESLAEEAWERGNW